MRTLRQGTDLLFAISGLVVLRSFLDVRLAVTEEAIKQARELSRHCRNGFRCAQSSTQTAVLGAQVTLASQQGRSGESEGRRFSIDDFACVTIQYLTATLFVHRNQTQPTGKVTFTGKGTQIDAHFGDNSLCDLDVHAVHLGTSPPR